MKSCTVPVCLTREREKIKKLKLKAKCEARQSSVRHARKAWFALHFKKHEPEVCGTITKYKDRAIPLKSREHKNGDAAKKCAAYKRKIRSMRRVGYEREMQNMSEVQETISKYGT